MTSDHVADLDEGVGRRVRSRRLLAGITQEQLAARAHISASLIRHVEQGRKPASPAFIATVARALDVEPGQLQRPSEWPEATADYRAQAVIAPLRRELVAYRGPTEDAAPASTTELTERVRRASMLRHCADLTGLGEMLPGLLMELRAALHATDDAVEQEKIYALLCEAYSNAGQVVYKLGHGDLSAVTTERVEWAAARSGDELAVATADFYRAGEMIAAADWDGAARFLEVARGRIEHRRRVGDEPGLSLWGQLHLKSGLAAARAGDRPQADAHLAEARDVAAHVTPGRDDYRLAFDAASVDIWSVGLAVEAVDGATAVTRAQRMAPPTSAPRERVGHHHIDTARAWLLHGDRDRTFASLMAARELSPQQARHHPQVHETIRMLAETDRRRSDSLAGLARWAGVQV